MAINAGKLGGSVIVKSPTFAPDIDKEFTTSVVSASPLFEIFNDRGGVVVLSVWPPNVSEVVDLSVRLFPGWRLRSSSKKMGASR